MRVEQKEGSSEEKNFYVVGIGASAGGYEAIEAFFENMPPESGMAFVVVQHLSPDFKSLMVELLSKHTQMQVLRVEDEMEVCPNCVYLIPPRKTMTIYRYTLYLSEVHHEQGLSLPINIFFRSLAEELVEKAIGIVLSGTGSDGTLGIRDIKGAGGMVMVQDIMTSKFDGMPKSALATGLVDYTLPPQEMPEALLKFVSHVNLSQSDTTNLIKGYKSDSLTKIMALIKTRKNIDFRAYKPSTIIRRMEKRMGINQIDTINNYIRYLEQSPEEIDILVDELLIKVTKFFREPEAFEFLKTEVLPQIFQNRKAHVPIRVWVIGCSTGEEVYSLAIIFREFIEKLGENVDVKVFGTDIDRASLVTASTGVYSDNIVVDVSPERLRKYFVRKDNSYHVISPVRKMVIFAQQDILKDAPFNKIDLVSCRNLLIYFDARAQRRALSYMHFALNPDSSVFLGKSETVGSMHNNFKVINSRFKIFQKMGTHNLSITDRKELFAAERRVLPAIPYLQTEPTERYTERRFENMYRTLMEQYEPSAILVNEHNEIQFLFGEVSKYVQMPRGKAHLDVLKILRSDLSVPVGTALYKARKEKHAVLYKNVFLKDGDTVTQLNLRVQAGTPDEKSWSFLFIVFEEVTARTVLPEEAEWYDPESHYNLRIKDLENELQLTKENLQATVEELETSNEELQATNEELLASNEELQSTNEELQSVNEELVTVNAEYQDKLEELIQLNNDFENLLNSTQIGTLFLDRHLNIRKFTPDVGKLFNIISTDVGRPISHFSHNFLYVRFIEDLQEVLGHGGVSEIEVQTKDSIWYLLRILQFQASDSLVEGVVVTLIDITVRKQNEQTLAYQAKLLQEVSDAIIATDMNLCITTWNAAAERIYGWTEAEARGQVLDDLLHTEFWKEPQEEAQKKLLAHHFWKGEVKQQRKDGEPLYVIASVSLLIDEAGNPAGGVTVNHDITELIRTKKSLQHAHEELERVNISSATEA